VGKGETSPYLVHVVVDDSTYTTLGLPNWDRDAFGRALDLLQNAGARVIACDVLFRTRGSLKAIDSWWRPQGKRETSFCPCCCTPVKQDRILRGPRSHIAFIGGQKPGSRRQAIVS